MSNMPWLSFTAFVVLALIGLVQTILLVFCYGALCHLNDEIRSRFPVQPKPPAPANQDERLERLRAISQMARTE